MSAEQRREQLLDVTKAVVADRGFHAVSIETVAREAGITRPVVYGHFGDLTGLLEALVDRETRRALAQLADVMSPDLTAGDPSEGLLAALRGYLDAVGADPTTWRLVLMPPEGAPSLLRDHIALGRAAVLAQLAEAVGPGLGRGLESIDPEITAHVLSAIADEKARLLLTDPQTYTVDRLMTHARWALSQFDPGR